MHTARRNMGIYEVPTDDKDYLKGGADARLKLEKDVALAHCEKRQSMKTSDLHNSH